MKILLMLTYNIAYAAYVSVIIKHFFLDDQSVEETLTGSSDRISSKV